MKWYFAISELSLSRPGFDWKGMIRGAVNSAVRNTSLLPHLIYDGNTNTFIDELKSLGVVIVPHRISCYDTLIDRGEKEKSAPGFVANYSGALLRTEIPIIEQEDTYVLYTDCDVMFLNEPALSTVLPRYIAAAPEESQYHLRGHEYRCYGDECSGAED